MIGKIIRAFSNDWKKFSGEEIHRREERGREGGGISATKGTKGEGRRAGGGTGGGNLRECLECRCADLNGLEGEEIYIEKHENRFADRNAWSADGMRSICSVWLSPVATGGNKGKQTFCVHLRLQPFGTHGNATTALLLSNASASAFQQFPLLHYAIP